MAQTIEAYVGNALDEAKISPTASQSGRTDRRGIFLRRYRSDRCFGSLVPYMLHPNLRLAQKSPWLEARHIRHVHRQPRDKASSATGAAADSSISSTCWCSAFSRSSVHSRRMSRCLSSAALSRASALGRSSRWPSLMLANIRLSEFADEFSPSCISSVVPASGRSAPRWCFCLALQFSPPRPTPSGACAWIIIGTGALIVWVFRFSCRNRPRYLATHGRGKRPSTCSPALEIQSVPE